MRSRSAIKSPYPYFGGKSAVIGYVWQRLGDVDNFIDPFSGSVVSFLARPSGHQPKVETANDRNCYIANFWRAIQRDPEGVAHYADWPVSEADLRARHRWLVGLQDEPPRVPSAFDRDDLRVAYLAGYRRGGESYAASFRAKVLADPEYFDAKFAGWWCWGQCCWIGGGWCNYSDGVERRPVLSNPSTLHHKRNSLGNQRGILNRLKEELPDIGRDAGRGVHRRLKEQMPDMSGESGAYGRGVVASAGHRKMPFLHGHQVMPGVHKRPKLSGRSEREIGAGIHAATQEHRPQLADAYSRGRGVHGNDALSTTAQRRLWLLEWFGRLSDRMRHVRVCCGDWLRVCDSESVTTRLGTTGIFLDPPYRMTTTDGRHNREKRLYTGDGDQNIDGIVDRVIAYCVERGGDPQMRIVACCLEGEGYEVLAEHGWREVPWKAGGGYGNRNKTNTNRTRERLWVSPHCLPETDRRLF